MNEKKRKSKLKTIGLLCFLVVLLACIIGGIIYFTQRNDDKIDYTQAKTVVSDFLESYKSKQPNTIKYLQYSVNDSGMNFEGFQGLLAEQIEFTIKDVKQKENQIIVATEITNVDLKKVFNDVVNQLSTNATQEETLEALELKITENNCAQKTFECEIILVDNEGYKLIMTDTLSNALLGGYNEYLAELTASQEVSDNE